MAEEPEEFDLEIDVRTTPRPIRVGTDKYYLIPELMGPEFIGTFNSFEKKQKELNDSYEEKISPQVSKNLFSNEEEHKRAIAQKISRDPNYLGEVRDLMKNLISQFMIDESKQKFLDQKYPDRVYSTIINKLISIYTDRPTTSATELGG